MRAWTKTEDEKLTALYPTHDRTQLAKILNRSKSAIHNRTFKLKLTKQENSGRIKKGNVPFNKGLKQAEFLTHEQIENSAKTRFRPGATPHNYKPVGSTRINKDGYLEIKVEDPKKWMAAHRLKYQLEFGEIPEGCNVQFIDKNRMNLDITNLFLIDKAGNMKKNSIQRFTPEIRELIYLKRKINAFIINHGKK